LILHGLHSAKIQGVAMGLLQTIDHDLNQAVKDKNEVTRSTLRLLKSSIKNQEIALGKFLDEKEIITLIQKEIKQRKDSIEQYNKANRPELAQNERKELEVLEKYLPPQMTDERLKSLINQAITQSEASSPKDTGKVMSIIMPQVQGKADGSRVSALVQEALSHE
jgi:uncharacterized protein YqeY